MLKKAAVVVGVLMVLGLAGSARAAYKEVSLNGDWDFTFKSKLIADTPELPDASSYDKKAKVPDYLSFQGVGSGNGIAFYRRFVDIPADWTGRSIQLYIGRAYDRVNVWVNGKHIAFYPYITMTPLLLDLSAVLKSGEKNEIIISVDSTIQNKLTHKYRALGGIVEPVKLLVSKGPGRIDSLYIRPGKDLKEVSWQADLKALSKEESLGNSCINWLIKEWKSEKVIGKGSVKAGKFTGDITIKWASEHKDIKPWSPNHTNLYMAELSWEKKGKVIDTLRQRFGLRRWSSVERALKLNGKPIYLRQYMGSTEKAAHWRYPQDKDYWLKYFQLIKARGYNSVDWMDIASQEALEAADEIGIVIQCGYLWDARKYLQSTLKIKRYATTALDVPFLWAKIARWTRNYPSMSIYILGGEMAYYDGFIDDVAKCNNAIKSVNPESMLLPNQAMSGIEYTFAPEDRPYVKNGVHTERLEKITKCSDIFGQYPGGVFSYHPLNGAWQDINKGLTVYKRPLISHEVMQSNRPDTFYLLKDGKISTLRYGRKGRENMIYRWGRWPTSKAAIEREISAMQQATAEQQQRHKKKVICFKNMSRLANILFKYVGEKMRKCDNVIGYQDICGHGGLNRLLEDSLGFSAEGFRKFNNDSVLLLDWDNGMCLKCNYWETELFEAKVMISLYGDQSIQQGKLSWELKEGDKVLLHGSSQTGNVLLGKVTTLKTLKFNWPKITKNSKLNLSVKLSGNGQTLSGQIIPNDWDFWVFKEELAPQIKAACTHNMYIRLKPRYSTLRYLKENTSEEKLWIVDLLNEKAIRHLEEGGDVLLIGGRPFPLHTRWPKFEQGYRNHHNHGTIVHKHPVFKDIPNEGWGNWQFYPLLNGSAPVVFRNERGVGYSSKPMLHKQQRLMKEVPFKPILEVLHGGLSADQASIFELKAGKGRLFVTTCVMDMKDPVCITLMDSILKYITGPQFNPSAEVKPSALRAFLEGSGALITEGRVSLNLRNFIGGGLFPKYKNFFIVPKDMACIKPKEKTEVSFELTASQIPKTDEKYLLLSIDGQDCDKPGTAEVEILLNGHRLFKGINQCVKAGWSEWNIPFDKTYLIAGTNTLTFRNLETMAPSGHKWFGFAAVTLKADDKYVKERTVSKKPDKNDRIPPVMRLVSTPPIEAHGHQYFATRNTVFEIKAEDKLSGIKVIEISVDGAPYITCEGPFTLGMGVRDPKKPGIRTIKCRATDWSGNQTTTLKGASEEGLDMESMRLEIR